MSGKINGNWQRSTDLTNPPHAAEAPVFCRGFATECKAEGALSRLDSKAHQSCRQQQAEWDVLLSDYWPDEWEKADGQAEKRPLGPA